MMARLFLLLRSLPGRVFVSSGGCAQSAILIANPTPPCRRSRTGSIAKEHGEAVMASSIGRCCYSTRRQIGALDAVEWRELAVPPWSMLRRSNLHLRLPIHTRRSEERGQLALVLLSAPSKREREREGRGSSTRMGWARTAEIDKTSSEKSEVRSWPAGSTQTHRTVHLLHGLYDNRYGCGPCGCWQQLQAYSSSRQLVPPAAVAIE